MKSIISRCAQLFILLLFSIAVGNKSYGYELEKIRANLPKMLGASNVGNDFWITIPPIFEEESAGDKNMVIIYVASYSKASVTVEIPGSGYLSTKQSYPEDIISFTLNITQACPWSKNAKDPSPEEKNFGNKGIHIYSDGLIVVYVHVSFVSSNGSFLALPVSSLGTDYVVSPYNYTLNSSSAVMPTLTGCVAAYDNTVVNFTVGGNALTKTPGGYKTGETETVSLDKGEVFMVASDVLGSDFAGSRFSSNKPIGVVSGNYCTRIPSDNNYCDYIVEMELPTYTWGKNYQVSKVQGRTYPPIVRVFAGEPGTNIYRDSVVVGTLSSKGGTANKGWLEMRISPMSGNPSSALITGDKPIGVTLYNTGSNEDAGNHMTDPFSSVQISNEQYLNECTFIVPGKVGSTIFSNRTLNLIYKTDSAGNIPDDLEFGQIVFGSIQWVKVLNAFVSTDEKFVKSNNGSYYAVKNIPLQKEGLYKIRARDPFSAYLYCHGSSTGCGNPAYAGLKDLTKNDLLPPAPVWEFCYDCTVNASVTDMPSGTDSRSNLALIYYHADSSYNFKFSSGDIIPGATSKANWSLQVIDTRKDALGIITFADRSGNDTTIAVEYEAFDISANIPYLDFGYMKKGTDSVMTFILKNAKEKGKIKFTRAQFKNSTPGLSFVGLSLPFTLQAGEERAISVKFSPQAVGEVIDSIGFGDTNTVLYKVRVLSTVSEPVIYVNDLNFASVEVSETASKDFCIENHGTTDLKVYSFSRPNAPFFYDANLSKDITPANPLIIAPGSKSKNYTINFKPAEIGNFSDRIIFSSDAGTIDSILELNGKAIKPGFSANGYDWGRVRIDRPSHPRGPYGNDWVPGQAKAVMLKNNTTQTVTITSINITTIKGDKSAFIFSGSEADFYRTIAPGESFIVDVRFQPKTVGEHEIQISYVSNMESPVTVLRGIGVLPRVKMDSVDFGASTVNDPSTKQTRKVKIYNQYYDWADTLFVTGFTYEPEGSVSEIIGEYGSEGFSYDKAGIFSGEPAITVLVNDFVELDAEYLAQHKGVNRATIKTISDAEADVYSLWTGNIADPVEEESPTNSGLMIVPNPVLSGQATLRIDSPADGMAVIKLYDCPGNEMCTVFSGSILQGANNVSFDMSNFPSGVYFLSIDYGNRSERLLFANVR